MGLPWNQPYPVAWQNPVTLRVFAALPAAPAWDAAPTEQSVAGGKEIILVFSYTRGAVGGAFDFQVETSIFSVAALVPAGTSEWQVESLYAAGAVVAGADSQSRIQREYQTYQATGAAQEAFVFGPIEIDGAERIRVFARESGVPGTPGDLGIAMEVAA